MEKKDNEITQWQGQNKKLQANLEYTEQRLSDSLKVPKMNGTVNKEVIDKLQKELNEWKEKAETLQVQACQT